MAKNIKVSRATIVRTIAADMETKAMLLAALNIDVQEGEDPKVTEDMLNTTLDKWLAALSKGNKSTVGKDDDYIKETIVPWVLSQDNPATAGDLNKALIGAPRGNRASALLKRATELGLLARDRVRKNSPFVYAAPDFDFEGYVAAYDEKVKAKAEARIENARKNRSK